MEYKLRRIKSARISLRVEPDGSVLVTAPAGMSLSAIDSFVNENSNFIEERLCQVKNDPRYLVKTEDYPACKKKLFNELLPRIEYFAKLMDVRYSGVTITSAKKRFGSCTAGKHLHFSLFLLFYPPKLRDLVVVHELAHLKEMNHSKAFYSIMDKYLPNHRQLQYELMNYFK